MTAQEKLKTATDIQTVVSFLATAKANEFISTAEAKNIFTDLLKETGFKKAFIKPTTPTVKAPIDTSKLEVTA